MRREVYAEDGTPLAMHPYVVEEHRHQIQCLQPLGKERHAVFSCHEQQAVVRHYERNPADPRVEHRFNLEVDAYGNVLRSAHVAYPRRAPAEPEQAALLATCADASVVNETTAFYRIGVPVEARAYELTGLAPRAGVLLAFEDVDAATTSAASIAFDATPAPSALQKRLLSHHRTLYLSDDLRSPLPLGQRRVTRARVRGVREVDDTEPRHERARQRGHAVGAVERRGLRQPPGRRGLVAPFGQAHVRRDALLPGHGDHGSLRQHGARRPRRVRLARRGVAHVRRSDRRQRHARRPTTTASCARRW